MGEIPYKEVLRTLLENENRYISRSSSMKKTQLCQNSSYCVWNRTFFQ